MNKLFTLFFFITSFSLVSQTIDIESSQPLGVPSLSNTATQENLRGPVQGTVVVQNGNGTLGQIYTQSKCGLNYTAVSQRLGQRFTPAGVAQPAPFVVGGIPAGAIIERAYLWAGGSGNGAAQTSAVNGPGGSFTYPMSIVGTGGDVCWSYGGTYNYRADVTTAVNGNGTYNISGLLVNSPPTTSNDMCGATLMVIYSNPSVTWAGNITIADGIVVAPGGNVNYTQPLTPICGTPINGRAFSIVDDLQMNGFTQMMNGTAAPGAWNWWNYFDVGTTYATGQTNSAYSMVQPGDCYAVMGYGTYYQNTGCITCGFNVTVTATPATCSACNGTASASVTPTGSYTYTWAPSGGNAATATGLCAGNYTVSVQNGATIKTQTVVVGTINTAITSAVSQTSVNCFGACTGASAITPSGGTSPYSYTWSPSGGNTATASGLCAGTYSVNVYDANGCLTSTVVSISQPSALTATTSQTNSLCNGGSGSANITVSGGTGAYTYTWSPSGGNAASATGLTAGNYTVTAKDANNCIIIRTVTITQPASLVSTPTQTNVLCNGGTTGHASVSVSGGTGAYSYVWSPSGGNAASATGLAAGNYTVTVKDANNCSITNAFMISEPVVLTAVTGQSNVLCNAAATGAASISTTGGTGAYTYVWSPSGGTAANATGLTAGTYSVIVRDANNCTITKTVSITQPTALSAVTSQTNVLCNGGSTGIGSVSVSNGTSPYTYTWSPSGGNAATASGLTAGIYNILINDGNNCMLTRTLNITQPAALTATTSQTNISCNGGSNGMASVSVSGGTGVYSYVWTPVGGNSAGATGLGLGNYTVTIKDANLCTVISTLTITQPPSLVAVTSQTNNTCGNTNGGASVSASGGTGAYSYTWSPSGGNAATTTTLVAGNYTVTIRDANNCVQTASLSILQSAQFTVTTINTSVTCNGLSNGSASVTAFGGSMPYSYTWSPVGGSGPVASGLPAGTYTVNVKDLIGCTSGTIISITQPASLTATTSQTTILCNGGNNGSATISVSGGTFPYTYTWSPFGGNASGASSLTSGTYTVDVSDINSCSLTRTVTITQPTALSSVITHTDVACNAASTGVAHISVSGGVTPYTYSWSPSGGTGPTATGIPSGAYSVLITDANTCQLTNTVNVSEASQFTVTASSNSVSCFGLNNGSATVTVTGGTTPYSYTWSPSGGNASTASGLSIGTYSVLINDINLCSKTMTVNVIEPAQLAAITSQTSSVCFGSNNGSATVAASGGTGTYSYSWSPGGSVNSGVSSLSPAVYSVTVSDINLCSVTKTLTITEPSQYTVTASTNSVLCNGQSTGSATVNVSGNTPSYTYTWLPSGGNTSSATGLGMGSYTVNIFDINSCATTQTLNIAQPTALTGSINTSAANCGNADGSASVTVNGGQAPYTYTWSPSGGNAVVSNGISTGSYTCSISDINNCPLSLSASVAVINPSVTLTASNYSICSGITTSLFATGSNSYTWNPSGSLSSPTGPTVTATPTVTTTYSVTGANAFGCLVTNTITINVYINPIIVTSASSPSICAGNTTTLAAGGASTYTWSPSATLNNPNSSNPLATLLNTETYTVVATNSLGCIGSGTITIIVQQLPTVNAVSNPSVICLNEIATLTANGASTYTWSTNATGTTLNVSPVVNTVYTVTGSDANGCSNSGTISVTVNQPPVVVINSVSSICRDQSATLTASGANTYAWNTSSTSDTITVTPSTTTSYTVIGTNINGCKDTSAFTVNVIVTPTLTVTGPSVTCSGEEITLIASGGNNGYVWNTGDVTPGITYSFTGNAVLTVSSGIAPCIGMATHTLLVNPLPVVTASASPVSIILGTTSQLTGTGGGQYQWIPAVGLSCNNCPNPVAQPTTSTIYTLEVTSAEGCKNYTTVLVEVEVICGDLFAPSAFSPNGDGNNDTWTVYGNCIESMQCEIFNRWGQKVYSITKPGDAWDGTLNGIQQNSGVFIFQVSATFINGETKSKKGNFTLVK